MSRWLRAPATSRGSRRSNASSAGPATAGPGRSSWRWASTRPVATPRRRSPSRPPASGRPAGRSPASASPPSSSRRAGTTSPRSGPWCARRSRGSRKDWRVPDPLERIWIGKEERQGIPVPPRKDLAPPPHWRLEAIAATDRPRSLSVGAGGRRAVFIEDRDTSDVYLLDLERADAAPERLTAGCELASHWEDAEPRLSPNGAAGAYTDPGHVWLVPALGGAPRRLVAGSSPVWLDDERLLLQAEHEETRSTRIVVVDVADPFPRRLAVEHGGLGTHGDEEQAAVSPDRAEIAYL